MRARSLRAGAARLTRRPPRAQEDLRAHVRTLKEKIVHMQEDVRARDEQIQKKTDQMLANMQKIKDLDDKIAAWDAKLKGLDLGQETDVDRLRRAGELSGESTRNRMVAEMAKILASVDTLIEEVEVSGAAASGAG